MNAAETLETIQSWPFPEQLNFAFQLWDTIVDAGWQPEPSEELKAELDRRIAAYEADPTRAMSWDEVVASVRRAK